MLLMMGGTVEMNEIKISDNARDETGILSRERALRAWFTRDADAMLRQIDGLDIGWGGVQRWATARMPSIAWGLHLDFACGYATFLAQLGWRHSEARLVGLNIDFQGPHALARPLLIEAGVTAAALVQADARQMPFADSTFDSASCFLGLQDVEIGFGETGVRQTLVEAMRVLRAGAMLILLDEFPFRRFETLLDGLPVAWIDKAERAPDVCWNRQVAMRAAELYAEGRVTQMRLPAGDRAAHQVAYWETLARLQSEVEAQMARQGYYVPFGPVRMVGVQKVGNRRKYVASKSHKIRR
jgi:ubiquinone/menaquinone biosynthesis C-methylase UbiE